MRNHWISLAQWLALGAMTLEHIARFALPDIWGLATWATLLGRIALPLFAAMIAWHLVHSIRDPLAYLHRLLLIALVAQLPYTLVVTSSVGNVVFTLSLGAALTGVLLSSGYLPRPAMLLPLGILAVALRDYLEYGLFGVALVPAFALVFASRGVWQLPAALGLLIVAYRLNTVWLFSLVSLAAALAVLALHLGLLRQVANVPRISPWLWRAWYPLHFALIAAFQIFVPWPG
ncbi:TraX family protein [Litchfieldella rifensis]|uniref:TraX family protein n=1 Tax=Litchfieldella rifensis TaxID=762643 RepID=A0ABV7LKK2_9GAMM